MHYFITIVGVFIIFGGLIAFTYARGFAEQLASISMAISGLLFLGFGVFIDELRKTRIASERILNNLLKLTIIEKPVQSYQPVVAPPTTGVVEEIITPAEEEPEQNENEDVQAIN